MNTSPSNSTAFANTAEVTGRFLLSLLFLLSGFGKLGAYGATAAYMAAIGVPAALLPLVVATEIFGGVAIVLGWKTRSSPSSSRAFRC